MFIPVVVNIPYISFLMSHVFSINSTLKFSIKSMWMHFSLLVNTDESLNQCYLQKYVIFAWIHLSRLRYSRTHSGKWMNPGNIWNICMVDGGYLHDLECLYQRVAGLGGDSTLVVLVSGHLDVSILSPFLTPAIYQSTFNHCKWSTSIHGT